MRALLQAAAEEVAREHPDGIDFLIVNAGVIDSQHKSAIDTCVEFTSHGVVRAKQGERPISATVQGARIVLVLGMLRH